MEGRCFNMMDRYVCREGEAVGLDALQLGGYGLPNVLQRFRLGLPLRVTPFEGGAPDMEPPLFFGFDKNCVTHFSFH